VPLQGTLLTTHNTLRQMKYTPLQRNNRNVSSLTQLSTSSRPQAKAQESQRAGTSLHLSLPPTLNQKPTKGS